MAGWIRIMAACWKQGEPYDDAQYLQALQQKKLTTSRQPPGCYLSIVNDSKRKKL